MKSPRWTAISDSNFAWEKEALDWLRSHLPDRDPWHVWSNFEFIDEQGKINEVDALVVSPAGAFLIEVKSRPGTVGGDHHTWTWHTDGRHYTYDNPLILANRKAKRLAGLLKRQNSVLKARSRVPFIEPLIFLSAIAPGSCKLAGSARSGVYLRGVPDSPTDEGIVARLAGTGGLPSPGPLLGAETTRVFGRLNVDQRLSILRQLAETLKYAHQKQLYHRALAPQRILVRDPAETQPRLQIMNWSVASRDGGTAGTFARTLGTRHVGAYVDDLARVFLAPESVWEDGGTGPHLDVFSLGAMAWQLFTGRVPAGDTVELREKLRQGNGLRLSDTMDGAGKALQELVQFSTCPDVSGRLRSMEEFLEYLELVEDELTAPEPESTADPADARTGDRLEGGFTVVRRIGKGSSSDVLLVRRDGSDAEWVLKVAIDALHNDRLAAEGEVLAKLRHPNIVEWLETLKVSGRVALLMKSAGKHTLAHRLRQEARPSLDLIRRFGEELLQITVFLEDQGVYHRDIKPDNIGLMESHNGKLRLILFDFSLSRASVDNVQAGTRPYLDPFLALRKPPRWDIYAERFAVAVTLYELVTGILPAWGDGRSDPAMIEGEAILEVGHFDPNLREGLTAFFSKALRRDFRERYDNAEDMLRQWRALFDRAETSPVRANAFETIAQQASRETAIGELGYSVEAQNVLDRMGLHTVRDLLGVDRVRFRYLKSVGDKVRKEIRLKAKRLAQLRPDLVAANPSVLETDPAVPRSRSIDELVAHLLPKRAVDDERPEETAVAIYLGIESMPPSPQPLTQ